MNLDNELDDLIRAFKEKPYDRDLWLIIADCCEEQGMPGLADAWRKIHKNEQWPIYNPKVPTWSGGNNYWLGETVEVPQKKEEVLPGYCWAYDRRAYLVSRGYQVALNVWQRLVGSRVRRGQFVVYPDAVKALLDLVQAEAVFTCGTWAVSEPAEE